MNVIYCFSGTGNTLALARMIADNLGDTEVKSIMTLQDNPMIPSEYEKVGFVVPTCFGHPSPVVKEIAESLSFQPNQKVFIVATSGGWNILTISDLRKILQPKTQRPVQTFSSHLPGNHLVGFGAWPNLVQAIMCVHAKRRAGKIADSIEKETPTKVRSDFPEKVATRMSETFNEKILGTPDIHSKETVFGTTDRCIQCGACERLCPVGNIKVTKDGVEFGNNCQQCMACIQWCPQRAITHPNVPRERRRYHHPDTSLKDMIDLNETR